MIAQITDLENGDSYFASSRADCRDITDASAFDEFVRSGGEAILMGGVTVSLVRPLAANHPGSVMNGILKTGKKGRRLSLQGENKMIEKIDERGASRCHVFVAFSDSVIRYASFFLTDEAFDFAADLAERGMLHITIVFETREV